jgi:CDGSH-type Zn-finger protein
MAEHQTIEKNGYLKTLVTLEPGEKISLCRCWKSTTFPICDDSHKLGGTQGPVSVTVKPAEKQQSE